MVPFHLHQTLLTAFMSFYYLTISIHILLTYERILAHIIYWPDLNVNQIRFYSGCCLYNFIKGRLFIQNKSNKHIHYCYSNCFLFLLFQLITLLLFVIFSLTTFVPPLDDLSTPTLVATSISVLNAFWITKTQGKLKDILLALFR